MKRNLRFLAGAFLLTATALFTGCNSDDDFLMESMDSVTPQTRATDNPDGSITITFDDFSSSMMAGPTSKGENYYSYLGETQIMSISDPNGYFTAVPNRVTSSWGTTEDFSSGCIALSKWNYYGENPSTYPQNPTGTIPTDWWYSWENQCSVYNMASTNAANVNAGHSGSNFAVVYGYVDAYNQSYMQKPQFTLNDSYTLKGLWYCNSAYTYGVMQNGNAFGKDGVAVSLKDANGYFEVILECYNAAGTLIATKTRKLAEYRSTETQVEPVTTWTYWDINVPNVKTVKFNFQGSDTGDYGLNTPAYICIDDITIE